MNSLTWYLPTDTFFQKLSDQYYAVFNPFSSKSIAVINSDAKNYLKKFKNGIELKNYKKYFPGYTIEQYNNLVADFSKAGLIFTHQKPVLHEDRPQEINVWLHITNNCNLRCTYCYVYKTKANMNWQTAMKVIDEVYLTASKNSIKRIKFKFSGGEALINYKLVKEANNYIKQKAKENNIYSDIVLLSNGTIMNDEILQWLKDESIRVMISLDGLAKYHDLQRVYIGGKGSFFMVEKTLKLLKIHHIKHNVSITLSNQNIKGLLELVKYLLERDIDFNFNFYRENNCSADETELTVNDKEFVKYLKKSYKVIEEIMPSKCLLNILTDRATFDSPHLRTCAAGVSYLVYDHKGNLYKCQMDMEHTVKKTEEQKSDVLKVIKTSTSGVMNLSVYDKTDCRDCLWRHHCCGGCPLLTYRKTGSYTAKSPNCTIYKQIFPEMIRLEGLRLLKYGG